LRPFAVVRKYESYGGSNHYWMMDRPTASSYDDMEFAAQQAGEWAVSVRPQEEGLGLILDVRGAPQHLIARAEFSAADDADAEDWTPELRWQDIIVTAYMLLDSFVYASWPDPLPPIPGDVQKILEIDVPGKHLDYLAVGTVVSIDSDGQCVRSEGGFIVDDRTELQNLARLMYEWYSRERQSIDVTLHTMDVDVNVGHLITTYGSGAQLKTVNSVVTQIAWDMRGGSHSFRTQFGELDLRGL
jgi:hypothetical protein